MIGSLASKTRRLIVNEVTTISGGRSCRRLWQSRPPAAGCRHCNARPVGLILLVLRCNGQTEGVAERLTQLIDRIWFFQ